MTRLRRAACIAGAIAAALLGADTAAWFWVTARMLAAVPPGQANALAQGIRVQFAPPVRAGWPLRAQILLPAVTADAGLATWQAAMVRLSLSPSHPTVLAIAISGPQSVRVASWPPVAITARSLTATVPLDDAQAVIAEGAGLAVTAPGGTAAIGMLSARLDASGLGLTATQLRLPQAALPFGGAVERVSLHGRATVPFPALPTGGPPTAEAAAAAWARAKGAIALDDVTLHWGELEAQGHGALSLDASLQPVADGTARLSHYQETVEALVRAGTITARTGRVIATLLDMMSTAQPGSPPWVDVPLNWRGGVITMGAVPLARTMPLAWQ